MNEAARSLLGEPQGSFELKDWPGKFGLYAEDGVTLFPAENLAPLRALRGETVGGQQMLLRRNGQLDATWISLTSMPIEEAGQILGAATIIYEIDQQKKREWEIATLNNHLRSTHELERVRLAQELHDGPMQQLYTAIYRIEELRHKADATFQEALVAISGDIQGVIDALRSTSRRLSPPTLSAFGLENAIRSYMNDFQEKHPEIAVELSLARDRQLLPDEVRLALFRVLQQAVSNVIRHSKAGEVRVRFMFDAEEAQLEVSDNGIGFEIPGDLSLLRAGWFGLGGEAERVRAQGGSLAVESKPGEGTTVRALVPWAQSGAWVPSIDVGEELHHVRYSRSNR
jgi:signal transduction histidine kinase